MTDPWQAAIEGASAALGGEAITSDAITADYRLLQRKRGHRFSLDDLATAATAVQAAPGARRTLDLGCGIGSVLHMVAWRLPEATVVGIEALAMSATLARRSIAANGFEARATVIEGDHREVTKGWHEAPFELVTGTPPYLPPGTALASPDPQRAAARIELRGGVEDYLTSAARVLADGGVVVVCADGRHPRRVTETAQRLGLYPRLQRDVFARPDASHPLFAVWVLTATASSFVHERLDARTASGDRTDAARALRSTFGL